MQIKLKAPSKPPVKPKNKNKRAREYLTQNEIEKLRKAARKSGRHGHRDDTLILLMFRHALRVGELTTLRWEQLDLKKGIMHVYRLKNGLPSTHPLSSLELNALKQLRKSQLDNALYVFMSERGTLLSTRTVHDIIARAGEKAGFAFSIHPHMLRHSTGFYLANHGYDTKTIQNYLGHANIMHTAKYTEFLPNQFKNFWKD